MKRCPNCRSQEIEITGCFPTITYPDYGEYVTEYRCKRCGLEFEQTFIAEEPMFGEEV